MYKIRWMMMIICKCVLCYVCREKINNESEANIRVKFETQWHCEKIGLRRPTNLIISKFKMKDWQAKRL